MSEMAQYQQVVLPSFFGNAVVRGSNQGGGSGRKRGVACETRRKTGVGRVMMPSFTTSSSRRLHPNQKDKLNRHDQHMTSALVSAIVVVLSVRAVGRWSW